MPCAKSTPKSSAAGRRKASKAAGQAGEEAYEASSTSAGGAWEASAACPGVHSGLSGLQTAKEADSEGEMVAELNILTEWMPEQMEPGSLFILENAGEVGDQDDPYWAVLACPECGTLGL